MKYIGGVLIALTLFIPSVGIAQVSPFRPVISEEGHWIVLNEISRTLITRSADGAIQTSRALTATEFNALTQNWPDGLTQFGVENPETVMANAGLFANIIHTTPGLATELGPFYFPLAITGHYQLVQHTVTDTLVITALGRVETGNNVIVAPGGRLHISSGTAIHIQPGFHAQPGSELRLSK